jgi:hypothetical protein
LEQAGQGVDAVLADRERHRAERADRGGVHHDADDAEEGLAEPLDAAHDRPTMLAHAVQREREHHGEEQHLQDLVLGEGADDA